MADRPQVKPGEWIKVADQDFVVTKASVDEGSEGQCEVIFDPDAPRHAKTKWNGEEWFFPDTGGGGYADKQPHLGMYVAEIFRGHSNVCSRSVTLFKKGFRTSYAINGGQFMGWDLPVVGEPLYGHAARLLTFSFA